jgi:hypothetical protein
MFASLIVKHVLACFLLYYARFVFDYKLFICVSYVSEVCKWLINKYGPGILPWHPKIPINSSSIPNWLMARYHQSSTFIASGFRSSSARKVLFGNQTCYFKQSFNVWPSFALADAVKRIGCSLHKLTFDKFGFFVFQRPEGKQVQPLSEGSHLAMFQSLVAELNDERSEIQVLNWTPMHKEKS